MASLERPVSRPRPIYLNLLAIRLPLPALVSILHRVSGALMFLIGIPLLLWGVGAALKSGDAWTRFTTVMSNPMMKLVALVLVWSYLHHLLAGLRHLLLDLHVGLDLVPARRSAAIVLVLGLVLTAIVAIRLW
jgi:succinate dehydrogenase / fumarate reductase cytochrome b subunit